MNMWKSALKCIVVLLVEHSVLHSRNIIHKPCLQLRATGGYVRWLCHVFLLRSYTKRREQWSMHRCSTSPVWNFSNDERDLSSPHNPPIPRLAWCSRAYPWEKIGLIWGWWQWKWRYHQSRVLPETRGNSVTSYQAISHHLQLPFSSGSTIITK